MPKNFMEVRNMQTNFISETEMPGIEVNRDQLQIICHRYYFASKFVSEKKVLEVGCGPGLGLGYLSRNAKCTIGGDITRESLRCAREHYGSKIELVLMDAHKLPFRDSCFDVVVSVATIIYLDLHSFLDECHRVLKRKGVLFVNTPNKNIPNFRGSSLSRNYFSIPELDTLFKQHQFNAKFFGAFPVLEFPVMERSVIKAWGRAVLSLVPKGEAISKFLGKIIRSISRRHLILREEIDGELIKNTGVKNIQFMHLHHDSPDFQHRIVYLTATKEKGQDSRERISVIIPTYDRVRDLCVCLDSIIAQTRLFPKEVLVIDNGTDTRTKGSVERRKREFEEKGIILNYIKNDIENSLTVAKNIGVRYSTGDIISFLDDDLVLDGDYYAEIIKVYREVPNALGVEGYNQIVSGAKLRFLRRLECACHFPTSFLEEDKCRVLPSLSVSYPHPHINKIIPCEWLSGASTYKREILEEIKPDENLKKYSWNEDLDLSYRIYKKYPDSLFMTPFAKYWHKKSKGGKLPKKELIRMAEVYDLYLFYKNIDQNPKNRLIYLWVRTGRTLFKLILWILRPSKSRLREIKYTAEAFIYCMKHMEEIKEGNLALGDI